MAMKLGRIEFTDEYGREWLLTLTCLGVYRCHMKHEDGNFYEMASTRPIAFFK